MKPCASVLSAWTPPSGVKLSVFAAPMAAAVGVTSSANSKAASLCGIVTFRPRYPDPGSARTVAAKRSGGSGSRV